jgi:hypothetical protein
MREPTAERRTLQLLDEVLHVCDGSDMTFCWRCGGYDIADGGSLRKITIRMFDGIAVVIETAQCDICGFIVEDWIR